MRKLLKQVIQNTSHMADLQEYIKKVNTQTGRMCVMKYHTQWFLAIFMEHRLNTAFSVDV